MPDPSCGGGGGPPATSVQRYARGKTVTRALAAHRSAQRQRLFSSTPSPDGRNHRGSSVPVPSLKTPHVAKRRVKGEPEKPRRQEGQPQAEQPPTSSTALIPNRANDVPPTAEPQLLFVGVGT
ncbi:hypothetical protein, conserved [Leishmania lindenbergi]|uniref:Uncharacterized protein n=1 Tax=Leishmania lindenbergi TaxID=651832 RepID=A0AAW3APN6_9TRYP